MVSGRFAAMLRIEVFFINHELHGVFYHLNKKLIATKHIADNNVVFQ